MRLPARLVVLKPDRHQLSASTTEAQCGAEHPPREPVVPALHHEPCQAWRQRPQRAAQDNCALPERQRASGMSRIARLSPGPSHQFPVRRFPVRAAFLALRSPAGPRRYCRVNRDDLRSCMLASAVKPSGRTGRAEHAAVMPP